MGTSSVSNKDRINSKDIFKNLKNKYILHKIFDNLSKIKSLKIIKYNKKKQKEIKININDYKDYSLTELEIIPDSKDYGQFININKGEKKYFHIYFDNNKEETKRFYFNQNEKIKKIKIIIDYQVKSFYKLFYYIRCIKSINFKKFKRNNIENMTKMFYGCSSLKEIKILIQTV